MKTLIIVAHPDMTHSTVNRRWLAELRKHPTRFTVHELYPRYANQAIHVDEEQAQVDAHQHLVLQFPVYWFNCPPLLKRWIDEVLTHGWAYGSQGKALRNKKVALAISLGTPAHDYSASGAIGCSVADALRAFELTMKYCGADYQPPFAFHTVDSHAGYDSAALQAIEQSAANYLSWLARL